MVIWHKRFGTLRIGRSWYRDGFEIGIAFGWREDAPENESPWRWRWSWMLDLPVLIWRKDFDISVKWTGREVYVCGLHWRGRVWMWA